HEWRNDTTPCRNRGPSILVVGLRLMLHSEALARTATRTSGRPRSARIDDAVLRTTLRHLAERGFAGMSVNAIAAELGVSKPTIYLRWPSKIDLATAAVTSLYVDQPEAPTGDIRVDLIEHVRRVKAVHDTVGIGLTGTVLAEQQTNPKLIAAFRER